MYSKDVLKEFIYELNNNKRFIGIGKTPWYMHPMEYFGEDVNKFVKKFRSDITPIIREEPDRLIGALCEWEYLGSEGIFFTDTAIYVNSPKNKPKNFRVRYDDIIKLIYRPTWPELAIVDYREREFIINTTMWNKKTIKLFLEFAIKNYDYSNDEIGYVENIHLKSLGNESISSIIAGVTYSNVSHTNTIYGEEKFHASMGHGFAAERANVMYDKFTGHQSSVVGDDNAKNGADRVLDGVFIQSKYCETGSRCVSECFENGKFRYYNADGTPMIIEVPSDKYEAAIESMRKRIEAGEVPGVTNPDDAANIIKKGKFSYAQAKNIAKAGTIESLTYDAVNGAIISTSAFGITATISFAASLWNGEDIDTALKISVSSGLRVAGVSFVTAILAGQLSKAGLNSALVKSTENLAKAIGPKAAAKIANAFKNGKNIYGAAAMKSFAKLLRSHIIIDLASLVVLSSGDITNIFRGRISGKQFFKNFTKTSASLAGGTVAFIAAAPLGPIASIVAALAGGAVSETAATVTLDTFIKDDSEKMLLFIEAQLITMSDEYLLTQREVEHTIDRIGEDLTPRDLKDMYASDNRLAFAHDFLLPIIEDETRRRKKVLSLETKQLQYGLRLVLEDIPDEEVNSEMN